MERSWTELSQENGRLVKGIFSDGCADKVDVQLQLEQIPEMPQRRAYLSVPGRTTSSKKIFLLLQVDMLKYYISRS